jgi:Protein of unknown function (DUF3306)
VSEPENFLSRWTRLKHEASETPEDAMPDAPADGSREAAPSVDAAAPSAPTLEPTIDLSALPSIESITATTDIRAFLAPGVPAELTRAALRRAWVADPQIRNFVGIAENQWDFNDPNGIPGFGPLGPLDDVRRLVAQVMGEMDKDPKTPATPADAENSVGAPIGGDTLASSLAASDATAGEAVTTESEPLPPAPPPDADVQRSEISIAMQKEEPEEAPRAFLDAPVRRAHGGALPE